MAFSPESYLIDLRGKKYLETKWRIVWFRDVHPNGRIETELIMMEPFPVFRAIVKDAEGNIIASGFGGASAGNKNVVWSGREIEKAETAAIGRALGHAGFGTQFSESDDDHLADVPVQRNSQKNTTTHKPESKPSAPSKPAPSSNGGAVDDPTSFWTTIMNATGMKPPEIKKQLGIETIDDWKGDAQSAIKFLQGPPEEPTAEPVGTGRTPSDPETTEPAEPAEVEENTESVPF